MSSAANAGRERLNRRLPLISDPAARARVEALVKTDEEALRITVERPGTKKRIAGEDCELVVVKAGADELFRAFLSTRAAPALEQPWLATGRLFSDQAAAKLAELKGLVLEATFPLPGGGRLELATERLAEAREDPGDYDDPSKSGYVRLGGPEKIIPKPDAKKPDAKTPDTKTPDPKAPDAKKPAGQAGTPK
jgi:hypothetical protein